MKAFIAIAFGFGMTLSSFLYVPQAWQIWKTRNARGISLLTFAGFNLLQFLGALHGYFQGDRALMFGMLATLVSCGAVTILIIYFGNRAPAQGAR